MKGKRLFLLLKELTRKEHRQLINHCATSSDKRDVALLELLRKRNLSEGSMEKWLELMASKWNVSASEKDKKQRRWLDYACKEVEQLLLRNQYSVSEKRFHELSKVFSARNHPELQHYYYKKAIESAQKNKWHDILIEEYDTAMKWLSRNQTEKNIAHIRILIGKRRTITELRYHEEMSYIHTLNSSLFLDAPATAEGKAMIPDQSWLTHLRQTAPDNVSSILYQLAEARYNFYVRVRFENLLKQCFEHINEASMPKKERDILTRSALYVKITGGLYYGNSIEEMRRDAELMFYYSLKHHMRDTTGFFLLLFLLLIEGNFSLYQDYLNKHRKVLFVKGTEDYLSFLSAFQFYMEGQHRKAVQLLIDISYSHNHYLAIWSRLLEISIHLKDGEKQLCTVMVNRARRTLSNTNFPLILQKPVSDFLQVIEAQLKNRKAALPVNCFGYYKILIKG